MESTSPRTLATDGAGRQVVLDYATLRRTVRICNVRMGRPVAEHDVEDVIQEVSVTCWQRQDTFGGRASIDAWTYGIARLCILRHIRQARYLEVSGPPEENGGDAWAAPVASPGTQADTGIWRTLLAGLRAAGTTAATIVRHRDLEDRSFLEIGANLGASEAAVKARYYRALPRLRERLRHVWRDVCGDSSSE